MHAHTTNQDRGNIDQVQNINMTLFHNPKKRSDFHIRKAKFSLFSSLNWIYFEQRTVIQFQNKQDHLCLNTINSTVKTKWFTFIFTHFLPIKVFFSDFLMLVLVVSSSLIQRLSWWTENVPHSKSKETLQL